MTVTHGPTIERATRLFDAGDYAALGELLDRIVAGSVEPGRDELGALRSLLVAWHAQTIARRQSLGVQLRQLNEQEHAARRYQSVALGS